MVSINLTVNERAENFIEVFYEVANSLLGGNKARLS